MKFDPVFASNLLTLGDMFHSVVQSRRQNQRTHRSPEISPGLLGAEVKLFLP